MNARRARLRLVLISLLPLGCLVAGTLPACESDGEQQLQRTATPAQMVLTGGRIFTADAAQPWAEAAAISDGLFVYVGSNDEVEAYVGSETERRDLAGRLVVPGIIDAHTHPGLVSILGDGALGTEPDEGNASGAAFPQTSLEDIQDWLGDYAENNGDFIIFAGDWPVELFGVEGPRKEWIDAVIPDRMVLLFDTSGHSQWANSAVFSVLGIDKETPDPAPGLSFFVRDEDGEPTGWIKEFAAVQVGGGLLLPSDEQLRANLRAVVDWFAARGVTSLMDAGNLEFDDEVYGILADFDAADQLPLRYEGSYHIFLPGQVDDAINEVNRFRSQYGGERLTFNTIKIHFDGVLEIRTADVLQVYADDTANSGRTLLSAERVTQLLLDMQGGNMNLHMHCVGDGAARAALDAVEAAQQAVGGPLDSRVTISHIEVLAEIDVARFAELGVLANFTPHWHGEFGDGVSRATAGPLGPERNAIKHRAKLLHDAGAVVTYSSDVTASVRRASPFLGIQVGHTRQDEASAPVTPPEDQRLPLERLLEGYTANAAFQLGWEDRLGSIEAGKAADLVVLDRDLFTIDPYELSEAMPVAVMIEGQVTQGSLQP